MHNSEAGGGGREKDTETHTQSVPLCKLVLSSSVCISKASAQAAGVTIAEMSEIAFLLQENTSLLQEVATGINRRHVSEPTRLFLEVWSPSQVQLLNTPAACCLPEFQNSPSYTVPAANYSLLVFLKQLSPRPSHPSAFALFKEEASFFVLQRRKPSLCAP